MAIKKRLLDVSFTLAEGTFPEGNDTIILRQLRTKARITKAGGTTMNGLDLQVFGMTPDQMNKLSTQGRIITTKQKNTVTIKAGDSDSGTSTVFIGTIFDAWGDYGGMPNVAFHVGAQAGLSEALMPADPTSFKGGVDIKTILQKQADKMGLKFEGNGISKQLSNPYLTGSPRVQTQQAVQAAGVEWAIDDGVLAIWEPGKSREGDPVEIGPDTGMIGYPSYTSYGLMIRTVFNPALRFGGSVTVKSSIPGANGKWAINRLDHDLDSNDPGGQWQSTIMVVPWGLQPIVATGSGL